MFRSLDVILRDPANYADREERQAQDDNIVLVREYFARVMRERTGAIVAKILRAAGLLNLGRHDRIWVWRRFPKPLGRVRVVSIKPAIQRYQTRFEQLLYREMEREQQRRHRRVERQRRKCAPDNIVPLFR